MDCKEIIIYIVIPLLCAIIGGICTVGGVYLTIIYQNKKDKKEILLRNKPVFFCYKSNQDYNYNNTSDYFFGNSKSFFCKIIGIFKNTEKAIFKLDRIIVNEDIFLPINGVFIDKEKTFQIIAYINQKITDNSLCYLIVKDIEDNEYKYQMKFEKITDDNIAIIENIVEKSKKDD